MPIEDNLLQFEILDKAALLSGGHELIVNCPYPDIVTGGLIASGIQFLGQYKKAKGQPKVTGSPFPVKASATTD